MKKDYRTDGNISEAAKRIRKFIFNQKCLSSTLDTSLVQEIIVDKYNDLEKCLNIELKTKKIDYCQRYKSISKIKDFKPLYEKTSTYYVKKILGQMNFMYHILFKKERLDKLLLIYYRFVDSLLPINIPLALSVIKVTFQHKLKNFPTNHFLSNYREWSKNCQPISINLFGIVSQLHHLTIQ